jgi:hypothetical protein
MIAKFQHKNGMSFSSLIDFNSNIVHEIQKSTTKDKILESSNDGKMQESYKLDKLIEYKGKPFIITHSGNIFEITSYCFDEKTNHYILIISNTINNIIEKSLSDENYITLCKVFRLLDEIKNNKDNKLAFYEKNKMYIDYLMEKNKGINKNEAILLAVKTCL